MGTFISWFIYYEIKNGDPSAIFGQPIIHRNFCLFELGAWFFIDNNLCIKKCVEEKENSLDENVGNLFLRILKKKTTEDLLALLKKYLL